MSGGVQPTSINIKLKSFLEAQSHRFFNILGKIPFTT